MFVVLARFAFTLVTDATIAVLAGGRDFVFSPFGATFLALWLAWSVITFVGRQRGTPSRYDSAGWAYTALGIVGFGVLVVVAPWEHSRFDGPLSRDRVLPWCGLALFAIGISLQALAMWTLRGLLTVYLGVQKDSGCKPEGPIILCVTLLT